MKSWYVLSDRRSFSDSPREHSFARALALIPASRSLPAHCQQIFFRFRRMNRTRRSSNWKLVGRRLTKRAFNRSWHGVRPFLVLQTTVFVMLRCQLSAEDWRWIQKTGLSSFMSFKLTLLSLSWCRLQKPSRMIKWWANSALTYYCNFMSMCHFARQAQQDVFLNYQPNVNATPQVVDQLFPLTVALINTSCHFGARVLSYYLKRAQFSHRLYFCLRIQLQSQAVRWLVFPAIEWRLIQSTVLACLIIPATNSWALLRRTMVSLPQL